VGPRFWFQTGHSEAGIEGRAQQGGVFYRKALEKYGKVTSCPDSSAKASDKQKNKDLSCDDDDSPEPGEVELKAGTKESQHIVAIEPNGTGTSFSLLYVEAKGSDSDKEPI
jgi:hypothetical protein